jgi:hypothetical protein
MTMTMQANQAAVNGSWTFLSPSTTTNASLWDPAGGLLQLLPYTPLAPAPWVVVHGDSNAVLVIDKEVHGKQKLL